MRNNINSVFKSVLTALFLLILWLPQAATALQQQPAGAFPPATSISEERHPVIRNLETRAMETLRNDTAMDYYVSSPDNSWWQMFRNWIYHHMLNLFGSPEAANNIEILLYAVGLLAIIYAILQLLKADTSGLFGRNGGRKQLLMEDEENQENIHEIDFGQALSEALKANEFNKAIRLLYLSALKELTNQGHIHWQAGKTNYQYQKELKAAHLQSPFGQLGFFFEHAWYGNFHISEQHFKEAERSYQALQQNLQQPA